jgi:hypothetical protein
MTVKPVKWSFSALEDFKGCPFRYNAVKVLKQYPFQETDATRYGVEVHLAFEERLRDGKPLPENLQKYEHYIETIEGIGGDVYVEYEMGLREDKTPCEFMAKDVWCRGIADVLVVKGNKAYVLDWKTGSAKYPKPKQLELMALMTFAHFPEVTQVSGVLVFIHHDAAPKKKYKRSKMADMWEAWDHDVDSLKFSFSSDSWPPKPNALCRKWCVVEHCQFNGR